MTVYYYFYTNLGTQWLTGVNIKRKFFLDDEHVKALTILPIIYLFFVHNIFCRWSGLQSMTASNE